MPFLVHARTDEPVGQTRDAVAIFVQAGATGAAGTLRKATELGLKPHSMDLSYARLA